MPRATAWILLFAFASTASGVSAEQPAHDREFKNEFAVLPGAILGTRGLQTVGLQVSIWGDVPRTLPAQLLPVLAESLRNAGATVILPGEPGFNDLKNQITILLKTYKSADAAQCAWGVDIELYQPIQLQRDPTIHPSRAIAYHNWRMGIVPCPDVVFTLRDNTL